VQTIEKLYTIPENHIVAPIRHGVRTLWSREFSDDFMEWTGTLDGKIYWASVPDELHDGWRYDVLVFENDSDAFRYQLTWTDTDTHKPRCMTLKIENDTNKWKIDGK
jgi:hypothetical protein